jgi:hypothetical protein
MALGWLTASWLFAGVAVLAGGLGLLLWLASHAAAILLGVTAAGGATIAGVFRQRAARRNAESRQELEAAWHTVTRDVARARGAGLTAEELAKTMQTSEAHAEILLASLAVDAMLRVDVPEASAPGVRIGSDAGQGAAELPVDPSGARRQESR